MHNKKEGLFTVAFFVGRNVIEKINFVSEKNVTTKTTVAKSLIMTFDIAVITYVSRVIIIVVILTHLLPEVICGNYQSHCDIL